MQDLGIVYQETDWPHGLMCAQCPHVFHEGERFTSLLYAFAADSPVAEVVCLPCASTGLLPGSESAR